MPIGLLNLSNPINKNHELNDQLITCLEPAPTQLGSIRQIDHCRLDDAAIQSATTWKMNAPPNGLASLNFSSSNINFPASVVTRFASTNALSVGLWIYPTTITTYRAVFDTTNRHCSFFINSATDGYCAMGGGAIGMTFDAGRSVQASVWQWLQVCYDVTSGDIIAYLNGFRLGLAHISSSSTFSDALVFGTNPSGGGSNYAGNQSSWRIWRRKFTPAQAHKMYLEALSGFRNTLNWLPRRVNTTAAAPFTGTAAVSIGPMTASGTATFAPGTHTATGAVTIGAMTASGSATFASGTKTATAAVSIGPMTGGGSATFAPGTHTATAAVSIKGMTASATATFYINPHGTAAVTIKGMTVSGSAQYTPPPNLDLGTAAWIGRYRRGERLHLAFQLSSAPAAAPIAEFWLEATTKVKTATLPSREHTDTIFSGTIFLDENFVDGHYVAAVRYTVNTIPVYHYRNFEVVGGDPAGASIAIIEMRRALGSAVIMQREDGRISMGYNPRIGEDRE